VSPTTGKAPTPPKQKAQQPAVTTPYSTSRPTNDSRESPITPNSTSSYESQNYSADWEYDSFNTNAERLSLQQLADMMWQRLPSEEVPITPWQSEKIKSTINKDYNNSVDIQIHVEELQELQKYLQVEKRKQKNIIANHFDSATQSILPLQKELERRSSAATELLDKHVLETEEALNQKLEKLDKTLQEMREKRIQEEERKLQEKEKEKNALREEIQHAVDMAMQNFLPMMMYGAAPAAAQQQQMMMQRMAMMPPYTPSMVALPEGSQQQLWISMMQNMGMLPPSLAAGTTPINQHAQSTTATISSTLTQPMPLQQTITINPALQPLVPVSATYHDISTVQNSTIPHISSGTSRINSGTSEMNSGTSEMNSGTSEINSGTSEMNSGTSEKNSGNSEKSGCTSEIKSGTLEINRGTSEMNCPAKSSSTLQETGGTSEVISDRLEAAHSTSNSNNLEKHNEVKCIFGI
jgi:X-X-X-Leu-X-X-Gly heptad repeat protein